MTLDFAMSNEAQFGGRQISEWDYTGTAEQMIFDDSDPQKITREKRGDEFYAPVKASEATIDVLGWLQSAVEFPVPRLNDNRHFG